LLRSTPIEEGFVVAEKTEKAKDAEKRAKEEPRRKSFDTGDRFLGWDAQQGALPPEPKDSLYADDPVVYSKDQLPDKKVLKETGYEPVLAEHRVGTKKQATEHDDDSDDESKSKKKTVKKSSSKKK
jgi:hypothetical protein